MPRAVKDAKLDNRTAREALKPRAKPYWRLLDDKLHLGYRKGARSGKWVGRRYLGSQQYQVETIGTADDHLDADGDTILNWSQAQAAVHAWAKRDHTGPYTISAACEDYIADLRARKGEAAARGAEGRLRKHLLPKLGDRLLAELTPAEFLRWRNGLVRDLGDEDQIRRSRDTANRMVAVVKAAFNLAHHTRRVTDDSAWRTAKNFRAAGEARKIVLTEDELQRLVDACEPDLRELVMAGAMTGCRLGELTGARVRDFDAGDATLTVTGKTGRRIVHLAPDTVVLMRTAASRKRADEHLFTTLTGERWTPTLHIRPFRAAVAQAGIDPDAVFYSLRHTWISRALANGVPVKATADAAGTSIIMLQKYYAKFIPGDQARYAAMAAPALRLTPDDRIVAISGRRTAQPDRRR